MNFIAGLEKTILNKDLPVLTMFDFFVLGWNLFNAKNWNGEPLKRLPAHWDYTRAKNAIKRLEQKRFLVLDTDFYSNVWRVSQSTRAGTAAEVACIVDPFAYVSHMSAMQRYGLTDRSPKALHITTPKPQIWKINIEEHAQQRIRGAKNIEKRVLFKPGFRGALRRHPLDIHTTSHPWYPVQIGGEETRITSIGQTFADSLKEPHLCGGMPHVLQIWQEEAEHWLPEIIEAIDNLESKIAKVRAGYIFSELLNLEFPNLLDWERHAQRGGSRKLDPDTEYAPKFSERWMLSINV